MIVPILVAAGVLAVATPWQPGFRDFVFITQLASGGIGMVFAAWMLRSAESPWAARCYLLAGVGYYLSATDWVAAILPREAEAFGMIVMMSGLLLFYAALATLFLRYPGALLSRRSAGMIAAAEVLLAGLTLVLTLGGNDSMFDLAAAIAIIAIVVLVGKQTIVGRRDARVRLRMSCLAFVVLIGASLHLLLDVFGARLFEATPLALMATPINTLIFIGLGLAIGPIEPFAAGGWAARLMVATALSIALLLATALLFLATGSIGLALPLGLASVVTAWTPFRIAAARRAERQRSWQARQILEHAAGLAFAVSQEAVEVRWQEALRSLFDPTEIGSVSEEVQALECAEGGVALRLPGSGSLPPVVCRHADQGRRLFTVEDTVTAGNLMHLLEQLIAGRDNYVRGRDEERERIARDLHDDVSGLLVTSLLRDKPDAMRNDVRGALLEIRGIVRGASAHNRLLAGLIAELRHEAATRLEAAQIRLDWIAEAIPDETVTSAQYRHLLSIVRESVTNVLRHASAAHVRVEVKVADGWLSLMLADDGEGASLSTPAGNGLVNCRRRAEQIGGTFGPIDVTTGFAVLVKVPLNDRDPGLGHPPDQGF
ncbi:MULTISPECIES: ATP-binding protein [unclassified Sphingobium]|uniref:sensor histidine kinase n=1 Tax=unclassified Sphingobium TaxID=2611147 RepID=UPI002224B7DA|nr:MULTISPECIES: ATP-binding protein [unclassified Sphingobium]MCW2393763.1 signal transduction histidine kinase [Sphingobium sp. B8D3B]MCW2417276.1 signal transduction histidine kinase [Sphingobium sp. B8D3C]